MGLGVGALATAIAVSQGIKPADAFALISDPLASPLVTSPSWIALSIAINELTVLVLIVLWRRRLRLPYSAVVPLAKPTLRAALGGVLLPFGLAPLAEVAGELV